MHYTTTILPLLSLLGSTMASPLAPRQTSTPSPPINATLQNLKYTIMSIRSASPVHFLQLNAIAGRLYLGGSTTSYCPPEQVYNSECPPGNVTVFDGSCALSAKSPQYPSGQTLWNTDDGTIGFDFNEPRPSNTYNCPWYLGDATGTVFDAYIEATPGADGFLACPTGEEDIWQVLRSVGDALKPPMGNASECIGFQPVAIAYNETKWGAWEYS